MQFNQLETFVCVAENGSFAKAAEKLYVSGSAVIQQVNGLEKSIGAELFLRTNHGVMLTDIGKYVLSEGKAMLAKEKEIKVTVERMRFEQENCIVLGSGIRQNCSLFYNLWGQFVTIYDMFQVRTVDISSTESMRNSTRKPDLIESINDGEPWQRDYSFLSLCRDNIVCAVPSGHPLANEKLLSYELMRPYVLVTAPGGLNLNLEELKQEVTDAGVRIKEAALYDLSLFTDCRINNWIIQIPEAWGYMCTDFVLIPCEWNFYHEYGFFYREPTNKPLCLFLDFVRKQQARSLKQREEVSGD